MKEKIDPINAGEQAWIATQLAQVTDFMAAYSPQDASQPLSLSALDRAFSAWMASGAADDGNESNKIINSVGIAFGQLLVESLGLGWVVATGRAWFRTGRVWSSWYWGHADLSGKFCCEAMGETRNKFS
jgi:hypothetical protein